MTAIRHAVRVACADATRAGEIARASGEGGWDEASAAALLARATSLSLVALSQPDLASPMAGFILGQVAAGQAEVLLLAVSPALRRGGIGRLLVEEFAHEAKARGAGAVYLEVAATNEAARALYAALRFRETGRRTGYYERRGEPPIDAVSLTLDL